MLAADDGKPETLAPTHELKLRWNGQSYDTMFPIAEAGYHSRGGKAEHLPAARRSPERGAPMRAPLWMLPASSTFTLKPTE
jgi:hypothetical protein